MSSIYKIQIEPLCKHHSLPFVYICITKYCHCQIKLCEKCHTQHEADNQNSNLMKIDNYLSKIETEVDILNKQTQKLFNPTTDKPNGALKQSQQKVQKFLFSQVKIMEDSMKYLNEEAYKVRSELKESSQVLIVKMGNVELKRKDFPEKYCRKIVESKLLDTMITFYSQEGFYNFREKLDKSLNIRGILKDFLEEVNKYGNKYEQFMKSSSSTVSSDLSMKSSMKEILKPRKSNKNNQDEGGLQFKKNVERENNLVKEGEVKREKRSKTIFGKN